MNYRTIYIQVDNKGIPTAYDSVPMVCKTLGFAERTVRRHLSRNDRYENGLGTLYRVQMEQVTSSNSGNIANLR